MADKPQLIGAGTNDVPARSEGPPTGPSPALLLDDGHIQVTERGDVTVVSLDGGLDRNFVEDITPTLVTAAGAASAVIVDLDQVTLLEQEACLRLESLLRAATAGAPMCFAASRLSARAVLDRWGMGDRVTVFGSVADALQVREFAENGYGTSW